MTGKRSQSGPKWVERELSAECAGVLAIFSPAKLTLNYLKEVEIRKPYFPCPIILTVRK